MLRILLDQKGALLLASTILLSIVCFSVLTITAAYQSKYRTYDSLEIRHISDTINKISNFIERENNPGM
ncbi:MULTISPECIES: hypothetical protein [Psychrobacillus]|jgi:hypothetical protein|uniref:Methyl-accepting chemotaxis protein n=1 Tax=Psychrobacillus faecigallinarum TaxID=2762235 RepID=A0ABR8R7X3_9BACI|nr:MULTISPECIES: hypothetical protein [Psychrobacillus]MBD7943893.1 hypothetical protein [Psychrobacillus faecigallinarum]QEY19400.1 hypothetical protein D0S48_01050 [Psychrobacillus sp. AK 1817]QGM29893.1 hypothetical protein GI482_05645 [Bacillus sp. N3536]